MRSGQLSWIWRSVSLVLVVASAACASHGTLPPPAESQIPEPAPATRPAGMAPPGSRVHGPRLDDDGDLWTVGDARAPIIDPQDEKPAPPKQDEKPDPRAAAEAEAMRAAKVAEAVQDAADRTPDFAPMKSRWVITPPAYEINEPGSLFNPYRQNIIKGDFPIIDPDIFLSLTGSTRTTLEFRNLPTPQGNTGPYPGNQEFFGSGKSFLATNYTSLTVDLFQGQQAFRPVDWRLRVTPVVNVTELAVRETGAATVNPADQRNRLTSDVALQEALFELHLITLNDRFDFISSEVGILPFRSDFRGFVFEDTNLGARIFGNADENKWQYNAAYFDMLEKQTNSDLNSLDRRDQQVLVANVYRQDLFVLGYTGELSFLWNHDHASTKFDANGVLVRPAPVGLATPHQIDAYYLGLGGDGHFGHFNLTHQFYQVFGSDSNNPFAARPVTINAQFAALEVSYDIDWLRLRAFGEYASGDTNARDGRGRGFDAIVDSPNFAGGDSSFWNRQSLRLLGVNLNQRLSPLPDLSTSKTQGQANFVNPGLLLFGGAVDADITPTLRAQLGASYMRFVHTDVLEQYLFTELIDRSIGTEVFLGTQWRPLLTNNMILSTGVAVLFPGDGLRKIYQSNEPLWSVFADITLTF